MEDVGTFLVFFSISITLMRSFNSATVDDGFGVSCVINSGCEFSIKLICCSLFVFFIDSFLVVLISLLMLTAIYLINYFMFLFSRYFTFTMIDSRRSFNMSDTWSFQFPDRSESEYIVMSSWVSRVVLFWGPLSVVVDYPGVSCSFIHMHRRPLSWMVEFPCDYVGPLPVPPLPPPPYLVYAPLLLPPVDVCWNVELGLKWGVIGLLSLFWIYVIGSLTSVNLFDWFFVLVLLSLEVSCWLLGWNCVGVSKFLSPCW